MEASTGSGSIGSVHLSGHGGDKITVSGRDGCLCLLLLLLVGRELKVVLFLCEDWKLCILKVWINFLRSGLYFDLEFGPPAIKEFSAFLRTGLYLWLILSRSSVV